MSTTGQEVLKSFDLLPDPEKRAVASEIIRRAFSTPTLDEAQLTALYADFADEDRALAEEGIEHYDRGLLVEDSE
jgi:hypothetical protein